MLRHDPALAGLPTTAPAEPTPAKKAPFRYDREALWAHWERKSDKAKDKARRKTELLNQVLRLVDAGRPMRDAFEAVGTVNGQSWRTISGWYYGTNGKPGARDYERSDWLAALVPGYVGRTTTAACSAEAWDYYKADYLRLEAPASTACYERLQRIAAQQGWAVPSIRALERRLLREIPDGALILAREGAEALERSYPAQERDRGVFHALEAVNADGHKFDVFVRWPDGEIGRPMMTAWQDLYSGKLLAWRCDRSENADSYRLSFGDMVEAFGIPEQAYLDNGRGIASKMMTGGAATRYRFKIKAEDPVGLLPQMGVTPHWTTPYHGQAKPIERAFRDLCEYVAKHPAFAGAYTGNSPMAKPENYGSRAIDIAEFLAVLETEINAHNAREGRRSTVCAGRSFDQAFDESYARASIRRATAEQRRLWLLAAQGVRAARSDGSVKLVGNRYWCEALAEHKGEQLIVRFDPDALHGDVYAYRLDGQFIGVAECIQAAGFDDTQAAREHARLRNQFKKAQATALDRERRLSAADAARQLPDDIEPHTPPERRVVRGEFGRGDVDTGHAEPTRRVANGDTHADTHEADDTGDAATRYRFADYMEGAWERWREEQI
ncbi:MAG: Mu transposase C-terminal domain-containing protein [Luteimonas sp.]|nr:Mu transposase C-terminal domain-containing protein [Luteimonas sp.]